MPEPIRIVVVTSYFSDLTKTPNKTVTAIKNKKAAQKRAEYLRNTIHTSTKLN